jgi:hypothetical protein
MPRGKSLPVPGYHRAFGCSGLTAFDPLRHNATPPMVSVKARLSKHAATRGFVVRQ